LLKHGDDGEVSAQAAGALHRLACDAATVALIVDAGGVAAVVCALARCVDNEPAAEQCCLLLDALAGVESNRAAIVAAGGMAALDAVAAAHAEDTDVVEAVQRVVDRLRV